MAEPGYFHGDLLEALPDIIGAGGKSAIARKSQTAAAAGAPGRIMLGRDMSDEKPGEAKPTPAIIGLEDLRGLLARNDRLMGIDLGSKTIGLALSDVERRLASPLETIQRVKFTPDVQKMLALADKHNVRAFVIGLPLNMDGSEGPRVQTTRAFVRNAAVLAGRPFIFWDERLSTAAVTRELIAQDVSRGKRAEVVDRMAAAYILQGALDRLARLG
jgi:putative Holliday junction resolvase